MTLANKCDACRKLKIKCDEREPKCSGCVKRNTDCARSRLAYRFVNREAVTFNKRRRRRDREESISESSSPDSPNDATVTSESLSDIMSCSDGTCMTTPEPDCYLPTWDLTDCSFSPQFPADQQWGCSTIFPDECDGTIGPLGPLLLTQPYSAEMALIGRWIEMLSIGTPSGHPLDPFGTCYGMIAQRLGRSPHLDAAAEALMDSMVGFAQNASSANPYVPGELSVMRAAQNVRLALSNGAAGNDPDLAIAVKILYDTAVFRSIRRGAHVQHLEAALRLLKDHRSHIQTQEDDDMNRQLFHQYILADFGPAMLNNRDSVLDDPIWLNLDPPYDKLPTCPGYAEAWKSTQTAFILLPRLARLVREARQTASPAALEEAAALAVTLYTDNLESWIQALLTAGLFTAIPTTLPDFRALVPTSFDFNCSRVFYVVIFYWVSRVLLSGLLQTLATLLAPAQCLWDLDTVHDQDLEAAANLVRCVQYARMVGRTHMHTLEAMMIWPMHCAFGAWARLGGRARWRGEGGYEGKQARIMKGACIVAIEGLTKSWDCGVPTVEDLEKKAECYAAMSMLGDGREVGFRLHVGR